MIKKKHPRAFSGDDAWLKRRGLTEWPYWDLWHQWAFPDLEFKIFFPAFPDFVGFFISAYGICRHPANLLVKLIIAESKGPFALKAVLGSFALLFRHGARLGDNLYRCIPGVFSDWYEVLQTKLWSLCSKAERLLMYSRDIPAWALFGAVYRFGVKVGDVLSKIPPYVMKWIAHKVFGGKAQENRSIQLLKLSDASFKAYLKNPYQDVQDCIRGIRTCRRAGDERLHEPADGAEAEREGDSDDGHRGVDKPAAVQVHAGLREVGRVLSRGLRDQGEGLDQGLLRPLRAGNNQVARSRGGSQRPFVDEGRRGVHGVVASVGVESYWTRRLDVVRELGASLLRWAHNHGLSSEAGLRLFERNPAGHQGAARVRDDAEVVHHGVGHGGRSDSDSGHCHDAGRRNNRARANRRRQRAGELLHSRRP